MFLATHMPLTYQFSVGLDPLYRLLFATRLRALAVAPTGTTRAGERFRSPLQDLWFPTTADEQFYLDEPYVKALAHVVSAPSMAYFVEAMLAIKMWVPSTGGVGWRDVAKKLGVPIEWTKFAWTSAGGSFRWVRFGDSTPAETPLTTIWEVSASKERHHLIRVHQARVQGATIDTLDDRAMKYAKEKLGIELTSSDYFEAWNELEDAVVIQESAKRYRGDPGPPEEGGVDEAAATAQSSASASTREPETRNPFDIWVDENFPAEKYTFSIVDDPDSQTDFVQARNRVNGSQTRIFSIGKARPAHRRNTNLLGRTARKKAALLAGIIEYAGLRVEVIARLMRRNPEMYASAADRSLPRVHQSLPLEATMQLMKGLNMSWSALRTLTTILRASGIKLRKCSEAAIKAELERASVPGIYHKIGLECGEGSKTKKKKKKKNEKNYKEALLVVRKITAVIARDLDRAARDEEFDIDWEDGDFLVKLVFDKGGGSSKFCICLCDIKKPCSPLWTSTFASYEQLRRHGGSAGRGEYSPKDTHSNFELILSLVPHFEDLHLFSVVRVGTGRSARHLLLPRHTVPEDGDLPHTNLDNDELASFIQRVDGTTVDTRASPASAAPARRRPESSSRPNADAAAVRKRAALEKGSAELIVALIPNDPSVIDADESECTLCAIGVRARGPDGDIFAEQFRAPVDVSDGVEVRGLIPFFVSDLAALAVVVGQPNQSDHSCFFCELYKGEYHACRNGKRGCGAERTLASQARFFAESAAKSTPTKANPVKGVSKRVLVSFWRNAPPNLHLVMGSVNKLIALLVRDARAYDETDATTAAQHDAARDDLTCARAVLIRAVDELSLVRRESDDTYDAKMSAQEAPGAEGGAAAAQEEEDGDVDDAALIGDACDLLMWAHQQRTAEMEAADEMPARRGGVRARVMRGGGDDRESQARRSAQEKRNRKIAAAQEAERYAGQRDVSADRVASAFAAMNAAVSVCHKMQQKRDDAGHGNVERSITEALRDCNITLQRYWNGTLVGNHCRIALESRAKLLGAIAGAVEQTVDAAAAASFLAKHTPVWDALDRIALPMRTKRRLTAAELDDLKLGCPAFAEAYRAAFGLEVLPKMHVIETHVYPFALEWGSVGRFGEDGVESLHPIDNRARALVAAMQNPEARHRAMELHLALQTLTPDLAREKRQRRNKQQLDSACAEAAESDAAAAESDAASDAHAALDQEIMRLAYGIGGGGEGGAGRTM
jgi:hypothetical protein